MKSSIYLYILIPNTEDEYWITIYASKIMIYSYLFVYVTMVTMLFQLQGK